MREDNNIREYPKVCVNFQIDVRQNYSVWRLFLLQEEKTAQKKVAMKEMMCDYLKNNDISIKDGANVNSIM